MVFIACSCMIVYCWCLLFIVERVPFNFALDHCMFDYQLHSSLMDTQISVSRTWMLRGLEDCKEELGGLGGLLTDFEKHTCQQL